MASDKITITFTPGSRSMEVPPGITILEAARQAGLHLTAPCGGTGRCGKCMVKVTSGQEETAQPWVLACQTTVSNALTVELPSRPMLILEKGQIQPVPLEPAVFLGDRGLVKHRAGISMEKKSEPGEPLLGLAVDIGTTTLVSYLYDLAGGQSLAVASRENGQRSYGADVISRLAYALEGDAAYRELRQALAHSLDQLILDCCRLAGVNPRSIYEIVAVGNTPMIHLLLHMPVQGLAAAPFQPAAKGPFYRNARELGLTSVTAAVCYLPPLIGGFVGSDALAAALAQGFGLSAGTQLLVDIGTNGEILLQAGEQLLAASAPAGPALEGGSLMYGMPAVTGAVSKVTMDYDVHPVVIGNSQPLGICGSGVVDAVAEMLRLDLIDSSGHLVNPSEISPVVSFKIKQRLQQGQRQNRFILADKVYLDQKDIREVQLAKAAVAAGIQVILLEAGIKAEALETLALAGGFGNYLNPANALRVGLLGEVRESKIHQVGNAAGSGAIMLLLNFTARERAADLSKRFKHLELANDERYHRIFIQQLNFPDKECGV
ncbi:MAG: ASKHA domain-containing protein [Bacillota bacterium]